MPLYPPASASGGGQVFFGEEDPGAVEVGSLWLRPAPQGYNFHSLFARAAGGWEPVTPSAWDGDVPVLYLSLVGLQRITLRAQNTEGLAIAEVTADATSDKIALQQGETNFVFLTEDFGLQVASPTGALSILAAPVDPSAGEGVNADIGSIFARDIEAEAGELYFKVGAGFTDWVRVLTAVYPDFPTADPEVAGALYTAGAPGPGDPKALMVSGGPAE